MRRRRVAPCACEGWADGEAHLLRLSRAPGASVRTWGAAGMSLAPVGQALVSVFVAAGEPQSLFGSQLCVFSLAFCRVEWRGVYLGQFGPPGASSPRCGISSPTESLAHSPLHGFRVVYKGKSTQSSAANRTAVRGHTHTRAHTCEVRTRETHLRPLTVTVPGAGHREVRFMLTVRVTLVLFVRVCKKVRILYYFW